MFYSSNKHPPPNQPCSHMRQEQQLRAGLGFTHLDMGTFRFQSPRIPDSAEGLRATGFSRGGAGSGISKG